MEQELKAVYTALMCEYDRSVVNGSANDVILASANRVLNLIVSKK